MTILFDLTTRKIEDIAVISVYGGTNCCIVENSNINKEYDGFVLRNGSLAQVICNVTFIPSSISGKFVPRLVFRVVHTSTGNTKVIDKKDVRISFATKEEGYVEFWKMINFLSKFKNLVDTGEFDSSYRVVDTHSYIVEFKTKNEAAQAQELSRLVKEANISEDSVQIALMDKRSETLITFNNLLNKPDYVLKYRDQYKITEQGGEAVWHHFLKNNHWILGLTLDIRFIRDFYSEAKVGIENTEGKGSPRTDLLGIRDYTVLVEMKTPNTKIFTDAPKNTSRADTWSFSDYFIDGISQCLGQKVSWDNHAQKELINSKTDEVVNQNLIRTVDSKIIFIIGNKSEEFSEESTNVDTLKKRDTFEMFRRNNRNLEIITYDELYERADFIVHGVR